MRMTKHFGETLRAVPGDIDVASHQLLLRAGYIRQLAAGIFSLLPLGLRAVRKIEGIVREEMDAIGGQEISMPVVHPAELWRETGRWYDVGDEMVRFKDRAGRDMVLGMTHEEVVADLVRREIRSYRQLPKLVYQIQTKFRDEPRPRAGLIRVREFTMKDSYSLDADTEGLEKQYQRHYDAYHRIFRRVGLANAIAVRSDSGMMGGKVAHEFMYLSDIGEDTLALCPSCGASANLQVARFRKPDPPAEAALPLKRVATPDTTSIESLAAFLGIGKVQTAKAVFFTASVPDMGDETRSAKRAVLVMAMIRGDMDVNETKLANAVHALAMRPATEEEIRAVDAVPGYACPIGIARDHTCVVVDDLVARSPNLVSGANETGFHLLNVNVGRDYQPDIVTDIAAAYEDAPCVECGSPLRLVRGVEIGNIFQLGTRYTEALGATFVNADHETVPVVMGSYGIGIGRLLACIAEEHHDDKGLTLPVAVAPYEVALVLLSDQNPEIEACAERLYAALCESGLNVMYDDRDATAGVKFADADLIGAPIRITVSARAQKAGGVEFKLRTDADRRVVPEDEVGREVSAQIAAMKAASAAGN